MKYILDTDTIIYLLKGKEAPVKNFLKYSPNSMATTIINHTELFFGAFNSQKKKQNLKSISEFLSCLKILPFDEDASKIFAEYKASLKKDGRLIDDMDLMIASIVLKHKAILVTNNLKHFSRIKKLALENWAS